MSKTTSAPYGSWESPITADIIAGSSIRLGGVDLDSGNLYWLESRPTEQGRSVLVRQRPDGTIEDVTKPGTNVRTRVHEYGGGSYLIAGDIVFYVDFADQRLYRQDAGDDAHAISPEPEIPAGLRYADMRLTPDKRTLVAVQEVHDGGHEPANMVVSLPATGGEPTVLASGRDFYSTPRISPDGKLLSWLEWDHPNMPWDGTELFVAPLNTDGTIGTPELVAGGKEESIFQPDWSPAGLLHFISDRTGWWNLYQRAEDGSETNLTPLLAEIGQPGWAFGMASYAFLAEGRVAFIVGENAIEHVAIYCPFLGGIQPFESELNAFSQLVSDGEWQLAALGGGPTTSTSVVTINLDTEHPLLETHRVSSQTDIDPSFFSPAQPIEFPTTNGLTAHALYYPPHNPNVTAPEGELPSLIVCSHGGPTGNVDGTLDLRMQFWTSRGFAVVDVNYGGSTGYGREYRERLKGNWGIVDIDDCANAARYLVEQGLADPERIAIRGGSAGGYTTLASLAFTDVYAAGASYYGVADLELLAKETHKFESRYLDGLVGPYPEAIEIYHARSAAHHTDRLSSPMIIFQGLEDAVVPPSQAEAMVAGLKEQGLPYSYVTYEGEQHGFRKAENIQHSLEAELYFYSKIFGFDPAGDIATVPIENL